MKKNLFITLLMLSYSLMSFSQLNVKNESQKDSIVLESKESSAAIEGKEVKNRNVMLNAGSSSSPRQLNIGLPFNGDILILENDVPVVYTFWTQIPTTDWRYDSSIGRIGVMSFAEGALTFGKVGYCVTSWDRDPGRKFKGYGQLYLSNYGSLKYDVSLSGPLGDKGWGYMIAMNETYDKGSGANYMFTQNQDRTEMFKVGISKKYKQGNIKLLYKYAGSRMQYSSYWPIAYEGNGKTSAVNGISLGTDSYLLADGKFPYYDYNSGEAKWQSMSSDSASLNVTHAIYLTGEHRFKNKMKLTYSNMFMKSKASFTIQYPISLSVTDADQKDATEVYMYHGTSTEYDGSVQLVAAQYYPMVDITTNIARVELTKDLKSHKLRAGFTYQYYDAPIICNSGMYYQTVEKNPKLLDRYYYISSINYYAPVTTNGLLPSTGIGSYTKTTVNKTALYFSDDATLTPWLTGGLGFRIENVDDKEVNDPYTNQFLLDRDLVSKHFTNKWNKVGTANVVFKATRDFGFLADATYNDWFQPYWDYPADQRDAEGYPVSGALATEAKSVQQSVFNIGGGIYWNHGDLFSLVSKVTHINKSNIIASETAYNSTGTESQNVTPIIYGINTLGWTTDVISQPFKDFNIHFLLTLQNPRYKDFSYKVFDTTYDYSNNTIPGLSKVLVEVDPSYYLLNHDVRLWLSLRYFGKQYGDPNNVFTYNGWWENFGGIDYHMSRNVDLSLQMVNFLNQRGVSGTLVGADQITDATSYIGRKIVAGAIRPRTLEFTAKFRF